MHPFVKYIQERPNWCPEQSCQYICSSQNAICFGKLNKPESHAGIDNTHRMCLHGSADDGFWLQPLKINKGDGWTIYRLLSKVFGFRL